MDISRRVDFTGVEPERAIPAALSSRGARFGQEYEGACVKAGHRPRRGWVEVPE